MSQLQSSVGLVTGFPIQATVQKLMALNQAPVTALQTQDTTYQNQVTAITQLQALLSSLEVSTNALGPSFALLADEHHQQQSRGADGHEQPKFDGITPALGNFQYTPIQQAQAQQLQSTALASDSTALGAGSLSFRYGPTIDQPVSVDLLNGGAGHFAGPDSNHRPQRRHGHGQSLRRSNDRRRRQRDQLGHRNSGRSQRQRRSSAIDRHQRFDGQ